MSRIIYVNGRYLPYGQAMVHVEDRGYQFADGVYEVIALIAGKLIDNAGHLIRLANSLNELSIPMPLSHAALEVVVNEVIRRNRLTSGLIYIQITRGVAPRSFPFPVSSAPSLVVIARPFDFALDRDKAPVRVITQPNIRWRRTDVKSISLLGSVLAKQRAVEAGAFEAIFMEDDYLTEGSSTNLWMVTSNGIVRTHPSNNRILSGITRLNLLKLCQARDIPTEEKPFTLDELYKAPEAFLTGTSISLIAIGQVNDQVIGTGKMGPITQRLLNLYRDFTK